MICVNSRFLTQDISGTQRYAIEISGALKKLNPDNIEFLSPRNIIHKEIAEFLNVKSFGRFNGHLWEQVELPPLLRKRGSLLLINLANTAPLYYGNKIVTIDDLSFLRHPEWFSREFYLYYSFLIPRIAKNSKAIITISEFSKEEIIKLLDIPADKIKVIYPAVSEEFITPEALDNSICNKYNNYILAVSSLEPRKNFKNLIMAFNSLHLPDIKLVIVGKGNNRVFNEKGLNKTADFENIEFTGYVSDAQLAGLYKNAKLFIYPSFYEGFGLPPLEAMACGCPVIVSNVSSLPEVCRDAAYYVDPDNIENIADGLNNVLNNQTMRKDLIDKGYERIRLFNWRKSAQGLLEVFK